MKEHKTHYRVAEISQKTGIPRTSLYDAINRGQVQAIRLGAAVYIPRAEAERLLGEPVTANDVRGGDETA